MGITHGALDYKEWFIKGVTLVNNTAGVYVDSVSWVNRHRLHQSADRDVDAPIGSVAQERDAVILLLKELAQGLQATTG